MKSLRYLGNGGWGATKLKPQAVLAFSLLLCIQ